MGYPPGFPIQRVEQANPMFRSHFGVPSYNSQYDANSYRTPHHAPNVNQHGMQHYPSQGYNLGMGNNEVPTFLQNLDDEVCVVSAPAPSPVTPGNIEDTTVKPSKIPRRSKKVRTLHTYFPKK